ncbi:helix-turn-helix transcriptional regulator [bacterium]|nr:helix-turn-helix transcriptional regulator [bacterium]
MSLKVAFGNKIKTLREALNLSQEEFAEQIGIHRNSLVKIEIGAGFASVETIEKIHEYLNISYSELFNFNEIINKNSQSSIILKLKELDENDLEYFNANLNAYIKLKKKHK